MLRHFILLGAVVGTMAFAAPASAAPAAAGAHARTRIWQQLVITKESDLDFGAIIPGDMAGTVVVDRSFGNRDSCSAALVCSGVRTAAVFKVTGPDDSIVNVRTPRSVTLVSGIDSMDLQLMGSGGFFFYNKGSTGVLWPVGGELEVAGDQPEGTYESADFVVTFDYP